MRQAYSGQYGYGPYNAPTGADADGDRLSNLKRAIDSIEKRLGGQAMQPTPPYADPALNRSAPSEIGMMQDQINRLSNQLGVVPQSPQQHGYGQALPDMNAAAREIAQRQQMLARSPAPRQPQHAVPPQSASNASMELVGRHLASLKKELSSLKAEVAKPITVQPKVPQSDIDRIAGAIAEMRQGENLDQQAFQQLQNELEGLRSSFRDDVQNALRTEFTQAQQEQSRQTEQLIQNVVVDAKTREQAELAREIADDERGNEVNARLDALTQGLDSIARTIPQVATAPVDAFAAQFEALRETLDSLPRATPAETLEQRFNELTSRIEELAAVQPIVQAPESPGISPEHLASFESRLDEIARALVAVSNTSPDSPGFDLSAIDRLEARMKDLGRSVHAIAEAHAATQDATNQALSGATERDKAELQHLAARIEGLTDRLGSFEKYAQSGDLGSASAMLANPDVGALEEQIKHLSGQVDNINIGNHLGPLEFQMRELSARVEENSHGNANVEQLSGLEAQIAQILHHLSQPQGAGHFDVGSILNPLESRFGKLEDQIASGQQFSMDAAQQAAQQAVSMIGPQSESGELIGALSEDLRSLQMAAESGNAQNAETVQQVHDTLSQIVDRLGAIEETVSGNKFEQPVQAESAVRVATVVTEEEIQQTQPPKPQPVAKEAVESADKSRGKENLLNAHKVARKAAGLEAPVKLSEEVPAFNLDEETEVAAPAVNLGAQQQTSPSDFDQLTQRAAERLSAATGASPNSMLNDTRPLEEMPINPVEKARRALQATTAEMNAVRDEVHATKTSGLTDKVSGLKSKKLDLSILRKPIAMAAAAVLLLAGIGGAGYYAFDKILGDVPPKVASAPSKTSAGKLAKAPAAEDKTLAINSNDRPVRAAEATAAPVVKDTSKIEASPEVSKNPEPIIIPSPGVGDVNSTVQNGAPEVQAAKTEPEVAEIQTTEPVVAPKFQIPAKAGAPALVAAAANGDPKALFQIGMRYSDGREVERNMKESAKWFEEAAKSGFAPAQYSIGSLYEKGIGVKADVRKAAEWYEKAAAQGNARSMHNLAVIRAMGNPPTVQPDMEAAITWFTQAANFGIKDSQFNLGILHGRGMGVPQNLSESYKWFAIAAKTGDKDATAKRDEVANKMKPADLKAARDGVNAWKAKPVNETNNRISVPKEWRGKPTGSAAANDAQSMLKKAQALLNQRGFTVGTPDGLMGPKTKRAIMEFQRNAGIPITGKVDKRLLQALDVQT